MKIGFTLLIVLTRNFLLRQEGQEVTLYVSVHVRLSEIMFVEFFTLCSVEAENTSFCYINFSLLLKRTMPRCVYMMVRVFRGENNVLDKE